MPAAHVIRAGGPVAAAFLLAVLGRAAAQPASDAVERLAGTIEQRIQNASDPSVRRLEETVRRLASVPYGEDRAARSRAEALLSGLLASKHDERWLHLRVAALDTLGRIARSDDSADALLSVVARPSAAAGTLPRHVAVAIGHVGSPAVVRRLCEAGLAHRSALVRRTTLHGLGLVRHPLVVAAAREHGGAAVLAALADEEPEAGFHAARAAANLGLEAAVPRLLGLAREEDPLPRLGAAEALGAFAGAPGVLSCLEELLDDESPRVREAAAGGLARTGREDACAFLVARLDREPLRVRVAMCNALRALSGRDLGDEAHAWEGWWRARIERPPPAADRPPAGRREGARSRYAVSYYGIPVKSDRLLFIVDISMSMRMRRGPDQPRRIELAREELIRTLRGLPPKTRFNLMVFSTDNACFGRRGLCRATPGNRRRAERWIRGVLPAGGTDSYGALTAGFARFPEVDTIYFLSDGRPSRGMVTDPDRILARVAELNLRRRVRIHTITLLPEDHSVERSLQGDEEDDGSRFMRLLAELTGGTFVRRDS